MGGGCRWLHGFLRHSGQHAAFIDFTAHEPGFLNDIAVGGDGLLYVTASGLGRVAPTSWPARQPANGRVDVNVLEVVPSGEVTWLGVEILAPGRCETGRAAGRATGRVPALAAVGAPNAWYYSRGC